MAIAKPKRPTLIVAGIVQSVAARTSNKTGEVFRHDVTVEAPDGGNLAYEVWERPDTVTVLPAVLSAVAVVAEVSESQQYGASLSYVRDVTADDLDRLASAAGLLAGSKN